MLGCGREQAKMLVGNFLPQIEGGRRRGSKTVQVSVRTGTLLGAGGLVEVGGTFGRPVVAPSAATASASSSLRFLISPNRGQQPLGVTAPVEEISLGS